MSYPRSYVQDTRNSRKSPAPCALRPHRRSLAGLAPASSLPRVLSLRGFHVQSLSIFVVVPVMLAVVALVASHVPRGGGMRVNPMVALRNEEAALPRLVLLR